MFLWTLVGIFLCLFLWSEYYTFKTGVPTIASFPSARRKITDILQKDIDLSSQNKPLIIDLGSGNGQLTQHVARALPDATVIGIELSIVPWLISRLRQKLFGPTNLSYKRLDFWQYDCAEVDVILLFLTENIIDRLSTKLRAELKTGAVIIANDTPLTGDWKPFDSQETGLLNFKIYLYRQEPKTHA